MRSYLLFGRVEVIAVWTPHSVEICTHKRDKTSNSI